MADFLHDLRTPETGLDEHGEDVLCASVDLASLLQMYEEDRPGDEGPASPHLRVIPEEEAYSLCRSILATEPLEGAAQGNDDPVLASLQEEMSRLEPYARWRQQPGSGVLPQSPPNSPPKKRLKTATDSSVSANPRQIRNKLRRKRVQKRAEGFEDTSRNSCSSASLTAANGPSDGCEPGLLATGGQAPSDKQPSGASNKTGRGSRQRRSAGVLKGASETAKHLRKVVQKNLEAQQLLALPTDIRSASVTTTGWTGRTVTKQADVQRMKNLFESGEVLDVLRGFQRLPYEKDRPLLVFDSHSHLMVLRARVAKFAVDAMPELDDLLRELVGNASERRGYHRPYTKLPTLSEQHMLDEGRSNAFINSKLIQNLTRHVCRILWLYFPECAARFQFAVDFWKKRGLVAQFGLFFNFCPNIPLSKGRVHTLPHADRKNIAGGLCVLMAYHRNKSFNSKERAWLVIWELGIVLELPVGVALFYPSALFYHFNIDIADLEIICAKEFPDITKRNEYPKWCSDAEGRGSLVWFNQASMIQSAHLDHLTVDEAKKDGVDTATDFKADADKYFTPASPFTCPPPAALAQLE
ncbi:hypothetical protein JVT61DRAFT_9053 [Boletus reticuloceps]|uniref:Uncharacterized protein n=1 Tax=Boletus reticuloceps TaxID=495285 RepID=A0A8I2YGF8_9AGAM|nr:hypothetical protein JVT61DRAFT_9053 [Boletus reticuloceps]